MSDLANFGDSVHWGQGHREADKFACRVASSLGLQLRMQAHSGATIGVGVTCTSGAHPEVPLACPTILDQVKNYPHDPSTASLVLLTGGINDVTVQRLITPTTTPDTVRRVTRRYCYDDMVVLLKATAEKFVQSQTRVLVSSYFPVFSKESDFRKIADYLTGNLIVVPHEAEGERAAERVAILERIIDNCQAFWTESTKALHDAVRALSSARVQFVDVPFGDENAMFADAPWLFEVRLEGIELIPEDPLATERRAACKDFHTLPWDRRACYIASVGHPNLAGSAEYTRAMLSAVRG